LHRPGIRTAFGFAYWHLPGKSAHLQTVTGHFSNTDLEITQINQVWNLLHSITKPFQQVFTSHHISWTKEFCTSLRFPDFRIFLFPCCYHHNFDGKVVAIVSNWQTMCAIVIQWQTIMMLRLKLNDRLVDIASEIPSKFDNSNIIFLNVNLIVNKRVCVLIFLILS
jgi:hypothetical protein